MVGCSLFASPFLLTENSFHFIVHGRGALTARISWKIHKNQNVAFELLGDDLPRCRRNKPINVGSDMINAIFWKMLKIADQNLYATTAIKIRMGPNEMRAPPEYRNPHEMRLRF